MGVDVLQPDKSSAQTTQSKQKQKKQNQNMVQFKTKEHIGIPPAHSLAFFG